MSWSIPLTDLVIREEDIAAVRDCLASGWVTMGPRAQEFEAAIAELCRVPHAVAVSSGTAALHLALLAAGVREGDEVLVPAMTFVAGAAAVRYCGGTPVFVESCGEHDLNLDPDDAERHIGPLTRAVLATHWLGYACDLAALERLCREHGLLLIEDCAQSITARAADGRMTGTAGTAGCLSFFSKKQLCVGEGGMVVTADEQLADRVRLLRSHAMTSVTWDRHRGYAETYDVVDVGFNFRIDEMRSALGLSRLRRLEQDVDRRRALVRRYRERLAACPQITIPWDEQQVERASHFGFAILLETAAERDRVAGELAAQKVQTTSYPSLTQLSAYTGFAACPRTEQLAARHLLLPLAATYDERTVDDVAARLTGILAAGTAAQR